MYLTDLVNRAVELLQDVEDFDDISVIPAYPLAKKPTRLPDTVITVSPQSIDAHNTSLGGCALAGELCIRIDAYVPYEKGSPVTLDIVEKAIGALEPLRPNAVKIGAITAMDELNCFNCSCDIIINSFIGDSDE